MDATQSKFEGWAVVEIFGHIKEVGYVTTEYFGAAALFRIDTPAMPIREYTLERPEWQGGEMVPRGSVVLREAFPWQDATNRSERDFLAHADRRDVSEKARRRHVSPTTKDPQHARP